MIDICLNYFGKHCLQFNAKKSKIMLFGKSQLDHLAPVTIGGPMLEYATELKYLGTTIVSGKSFSFTARPDISSFFRATNSILNVLSDAHERVLLTLLYNNCIPIITYACSVKQFSASDISDCNLAINNALRKVFGFS